MIIGSLTRRFGLVEYPLFDKRPNPVLPSDPTLRVRRRDLLLFSERNKNSVHLLLYRRHPRGHLAIAPNLAYRRPGPSAMFAASQQVAPAKVVARFRYF